MRPKILTVDDAKLVRTIAEKILRPFDCDTDGSTNGYNALFAMERGLPSLILLDVSMPIMGGLELLEMVRSKPELRAIPVIILASPADHPVLPRLNALGVSGIVMKPFTEAALLDKIRSVIDLKPLNAGQS